MEKWTLCAALLCAWLGNSAALAAGDAAAGKAKAAVCAACHGADGKAIQPACLLYTSPSPRDRG